MAEARPKGRPSRVALALLTLCLLAAVVTALSWMGVVRLGSPRPTQIHNPRYARDGRGVYYVQEYERRAEDLFFETKYVPRVGAPSETVSEDASAVPPGVARSAPARALEVSPDGSKRLVVSDNSRLHPATLTSVDVSTGDETVVSAWPSGLIDCAVWLDNRRLLVGISMQADDTASVDLLDTLSGSRQSVLRESPTEPGEAATVERMVVDRDGIAVFSINTSSISLNSRLYRYDTKTLSLARVGTVTTHSMWDYSPSRGTIVSLGANDWNRLVERRIEDE